MPIAPHKIVLNIAWMKSHRVNMKHALSSKCAPKMLIASLIVKTNDQND